ncbi:MAG: chloride channel protein [Nitrososphaerota archaeon]|nr:chloride channel protein [Nitrososphaerota archaeon]
MSKYKTVAEREESRIGILTIIAVGIGLGAGLIAYALYHLIGLITNLLYFGKLDFSFALPWQSPLFTSAFWPIAILIPAFGGIVAGLMIKYGTPKIIGHGIPETIEAILLNNSKIEPKVGILKAISAAFTIGSGQPFGAEGPIINTGGAFGSYIGQIIKMTGEERKILLASGAAAGMASVFGTPISAILLVIELLLFQFRVKSLVPVAIASAIGAWMHYYIIYPQPLFNVGAISFGGISALPFYAILGIISGLLGSGLSVGLYRSEDLFTRIRLKQPWLPAIGGLAVGILAIVAIHLDATVASPRILGVGYDVITDTIKGNLPLDIVALIMTAKAVAWIISMGSQTSGGTLAPFFLIGSSLGVIFGTGVLILDPSLNAVPGAFGVAAMAAVFGAASRAPFASIVFALEVTNQYNVLASAGVLPVIVTVVIAELVAEYTTGESIMTERLWRRGLRVRHIYDYNPLRQVRISKVMTTPICSVPADQSVVELAKLMSDPKNELSQRKRVAVLSKEGKIIGVAERNEIFEAAASADLALKAEKVCTREYPTIREDEFAYEALRRIALDDVLFLIVVDSKNDAVGYVSRSDLIRAMKQKISDESLVT